MDDLVRAYGRESVSFQALTSQSLHWTTHDGGVSYVDTGQAWVTVGGPLASAADRARIAGQFARAAARAGRRVCFFAAEETWPHQFDALQVGEQPVWDPALWPHGLTKKLARQLRQHRARGRLQLTDVAGSALTPSLRFAVSALLERWLDARPMAAMQFLVKLDPFVRAHERRYFLAEEQGRLVAVIIAQPIYARGGWAFETVARERTAPSGTVELLFDFALSTFAHEGCRYVSYGLCPLSGTRSPALALIRRATRSLYDFDGLRHFKGKLGPQAWQPIFLCYPRGELAAVALFDALQAFCADGMLRFGARTLHKRMRHWLQAMVPPPARGTLLELVP